MTRQHAAMGLALAVLVISGCENIGTAAQSKTVQGGVLGSALGAGAGAIIGNQTGDAGKGAAVGAGLGALGGGLMGRAMEENSRSSTTQSSTTTVATNRTRFCPVGGELYGEDVKYCPNHGVELRYKE